jgi:transcription initiation factor TFIID subunit 13
MSYPTYPLTQPGQQATTFPYGYPGAYGQALTHTPGTTTYPSAYSSHGYPTTGVTGYGTWQYPYNYVPGSQHHIQTAGASRPFIQTVGVPTAASTPTPVSTTPRTTTFTAYTPSYLRESVTAASTGGATGRGSRKQTSFKGMFTKEREWALIILYDFWLTSMILSEEFDVRFW